MTATTSATDCAQSQFQISPASSAIGRSEILTPRDAEQLLYRTVEASAEDLLSGRCPAPCMTPEDVLLVSLVGERLSLVHLFDAFSCKKRPTFALFKQRVSRLPLPFT